MTTDLFHSTNLVQMWLSIEHDFAEMLGLSRGFSQLP